MQLGAGEGWMLYTFIAPGKLDRYLTLVCDGTSVTPQVYGAAISPTSPMFEDPKPWTLDPSLLAQTSRLGHRGKLSFMLLHRPSQTHAAQGIRFRVHGSYV